MDMSDHDKQVMALLEDNQINYDKVHQLMDDEIKYLKTIDSGCTRTVHTLCYFLSNEKKKDNIWKIWVAKCCNMDTYCSIDIQWIYLCFDSIDELVNYITNSEHEQKNNLLERITNDRKTWLTDDKYNDMEKSMASNYKITKKYIMYGI